MHYILTKKTTIPFEQASWLWHWVWEFVAQYSLAQITQHVNIFWQGIQVIPSH